MIRTFSSFFSALRFFFCLFVCLPFLTAFTHEETLERIRYPVAAGVYYPQSANELMRMVREKLQNAERKNPETSSFPKALIVPESPLFFSGNTSAVAYHAVSKLRPFIKKIILIGAIKEKYFGTALSESSFWDIPGARFKIDEKTTERLSKIPGISYHDIQHKKETALELQLPFIHAVFGENVSLTPILIGEANLNQITDILDVVWGGPETLIIVVSDLSDNLTQKEAQKKDAKTAKNIETKNYAVLTKKDVSALLPVTGLLLSARENNHVVRRLSLSNSAENMGVSDNVSGFGAWGIYETAHNPEEEKKELESTIRTHQETLLHLAAKSILYGFRHNRPLRINEQDYPDELRRNGAVFVHLYHNGMLRGSMGSQESNEPLVKNLVKNAYAAAFQDFRYIPLEKEDLKDVEISISFLMPKVLLKESDEFKAESFLRPNIHGMILKERANSAFFLPSVWDLYPTPKEFLAQLKRKAGLSADYTSATLKLYLFEVLDISSGDLENPSKIWE